MSLGGIDTTTVMKIRNEKEAAIICRDPFGSGAMLKRLFHIENFFHINVKEAITIQMPENIPRKLLRLEPGLAFIRMRNAGVFEEIQHSETRMLNAVYLRNTRIPNAIDLFPILATFLAISKSRQI